jgi:hypothetical protein
MMCEHMLALLPVRKVPEGLSQHTWAHYKLQNRLMFFLYERLMRLRCTVVASCGHY